MIKMAGELILLCSVLLIGLITRYMFFHEDRTEDVASIVICLVSLIHICLNVDSCLHIERETDEPVKVFSCEMVTSNRTNEYACHPVMVE